MSVLVESIYGEFDEFYEISNTLVTGSTQIDLSHVVDDGESRFYVTRIEYADSVVMGENFGDVEITEVDVTAHSTLEEATKEYNDLLSIVIADNHSRDQIN